MNLNLGCGEFYAEGWTNVDLPSCPHRKDAEASVLSLPFEDGIAERVYCGHVLEHIFPQDIHRALREVKRVLKSGGSALVVGPDLSRAGDDQKLREGIIYGGRRWEGDEHRWIATEGLTFQVCSSVFGQAQIVGIDDLSDDWPIVSRAGWQCAVICQ